MTADNVVTASCSPSSFNIPGNNSISFDRNVRDHFARPKVDQNVVWGYCVKASDAFILLLPHIVQFEKLVRVVLQYTFYKL